RRRSRGRAWPAARCRRPRGAWRSTACRCCAGTSRGRSRPRRRRWRCPAGGRDGPRAPGAACGCARPRRDRDPGSAPATPPAWPGGPASARAGRRRGWWGARCSRVSRVVSRIERISFAHPSQAVLSAGVTTPERARSFGAPAAASAAHRPGYPTAAVAGALAPVAGGPLRLLDLAAGTRMLTQALVDRGEVTAVEPDAAMLAELRSGLPGVRALEGTAEAI